MPSGDFSRPAANKNPTKKKTAPKFQRSPPPRSDVQSSGGNYGLGKANKFKKTPAFGEAVSAAAVVGVKDEQRRKEAKNAASGKPFNATRVREAIKANLAEAKGLSLRDDGEILRKFKRSVLGVDAAAADAVSPIDPGTGQPKVEIYTEKAGVDAAALKLLDQTMRPARAVAGTVDEIAQGHGFKGAVHGFTEGLVENRKYSFGKVLKDAGAPSWLAGSAGLILDIGLDPTTYVTFGTGSVAKQAANRAATKVATRYETRAVSAAERAVKEAAKAGKSEAAAKAAAERAAEGIRREGRVQARRAGERELGKRSAQKGVTVSFGKRNVPGVTPATASAARGVKAAASKAPSRVKNAAASSKDAAREVRPQMRPAGTPEDQFVAMRRAGRRARAGTREGIDRASQRARGLLDRLDEEQYAKVIDAVEAGKLGKLPDDLRETARFLRDEFRHAKRIRREAGITEGSIRNYFPHALAAKVDDPDLIEKVPPAPKGPRTVAGSKAREVSKGKTVREANEERAAQGDAPLFSTDVPRVYASYMTGTARDVNRAKLLRELGEAGEEVRPRILGGERIWRVRDLKPGEAIYHVGPHESKFGLREISADQVGKKGGQGKGGRYVILNKRLVDQQLAGLTTVERSIPGAVWDRANSGFKRVATFTPGFHARNVVGDAQMGYLAQPGYKMPGNVRQAGKALRRQSGKEKFERKALGQIPADTRTLKLKRNPATTVKVAGKKMPVDDFIAGATRNGVIRSGFIGRELEELRGIGKARVGKGRTEKFKRWMQNREDIMRLATYKAGLDKGMPPAQAADLSLSMHIDYGDLTNFERTTMRRAFPFYTFSARGLPIHAKALVQKPGKFANYEKVRQEAALATGLDIDEEEKFLREFQKRQAPLILKVGGKKYVVSDALPLTLLNEIPTSTNPVPYMGELFNWTTQMLTPFAKLPIELGANKSFFFRSDLQRNERPLVAAPAYVSQLYKNKKLRDALGIKPDYLDRRTGKKTWGWYAKADYIAKSVPGFANFAQQLATAGSNRRGQTTGQKVLGFTTGVRVEPLEPEAALIEGLFDTLDEVEKKLGALNQTGVKAANSTKEYRQLSRQKTQIMNAINKLSKKQGDAVPLFNRERSSAPKVGAGGLGGGLGSGLEGGDL